MRLEENWTGISLFARNLGQVMKQLVQTSVLDFMPNACIRGGNDESSHSMAQLLLKEAAECRGPARETWSLLLGRKPPENSHGTPGAMEGEMTDKHALGVSQINSHACQISAGVKEISLSATNQ